LVLIGRFMKNLFLLIILSLLPLSSFSQEPEEQPIYKSFHFDFRPAAGVGVTLLADSSYAYANLKVFTFRYGEEHVGMKFLGLGLTADADQVNFGLSICAINANRFLVSLDTNAGGKKTSVGLSLNYSF